MRWIGRIFTGEGRMIYAGALGPTGRHSHHAFQIAVAVEGEIALVDGSGAAVFCPAAVIPPNAPHGIAAPTPQAVMLFLDPDTIDGRRLRRTLLAARAAPDWANQAAPLHSRATPRDWRDANRLADEILRALVGEAVRPRPMHPGVMRVLRIIPDRLDGDLRLASLAREAGISAGRLSHLFTEEVGIPLRPYVLWSRLIRATRHIQRGDSLTDAAAAAGFADSAHLTHTFRRMLGLAPSDAVGAIEWVSPPE